MPDAGVPFRPLDLLRVLVDRGVDFILIGGLAAAVHGSPYATRDVDVVPSDDRENLDHLSRALRDVEARIYVSVDESVRFDHDANSLRDASIWNLSTKYGGLDVTFVPAGSSGYRDLAARAELIDVDGMPIRVASLDDSSSARRLRTGKRTTSSYRRFAVSETSGETNPMQTTENRKTSQMLRSLTMWIAASSAGRSSSSSS